jgi:hypothetical protein
MANGVKGSCAGDCGGNASGCVSREAASDGMRGAGQWPLLLQKVGPRVSAAVRALEAESDGGRAVGKSACAKALGDAVLAMVEVTGELEQSEVMQMSVGSAREEFAKALAELEKLAGELTSTVYVA